MMEYTASKFFCGIVLLMFISGCAGIVNPHVSWDTNVGQTTVTTAGGTKSETTNLVTLPQAILYADRAKAAYKDALGNQSRLASWMGIGLIPLMSASAALAITDASPKTIAITTLTGVAGYGVGTWLYSKPYQRAWVAGYNATSCAVSAVIPLSFVVQREKEIEANIAALDANRDEVVKKTRVLESSIQGAAGLENNEVVVRAKQGVKDTETLLTSAAATRSNAKKMLAQADTAGVLLKEAVDRIAGQVSGLLVDMVPDLQALASTVGGLAQSYRTFASVPETLKPLTAVEKIGAQGKKEPKSEEDRKLADVGNALDDLYGAQENLTTAQQKVADDVARLIDTTPFETLRACGVTADQVSIPLSVDPAGPITLDVGTATTEGRVIKGGAAPFAITLQGALTDLAVSQTEPFGPAFVIKTSDKTPAGKVTVLVTDRSGNRLFVPVTVAIKGGAAAEPSKPTEQTVGETPEIKALKDAEKALRGLSASLPGGVTITLDAVNFDEKTNKKLLVDVSLKKGSELVSVAEAAKITESDIKRAIIKLPACSGLNDTHIEIRVCKPQCKKEP